MREHWDSYCLLSLAHFQAFPETGGGEGPILESLSRLADDDFFGVLEITRINDPAMRRQAAALIEQSGLRAAFAAQPIILGGKLNLNSLEAGERARALAALKPYVAQAAEIGADPFVVLSGPDAPAADRPAATQALADSLCELSDHARGQGVTVLLETFDRAVDKKALIGPSGEAAALAAQVKRDFPAFGLLYDQAHGLLLDETPLDGLTLLKEHLAHVHVGNCVMTPGATGYGDLHPRFGYPGGANGPAELAHFLEALFATGYLKKEPGAGARPWVGFEVKPQPGETSAAVLANIKRAWREAWARLG
jgi:sugar phosphate isomerase/epimerase